MQFLDFIWLLDNHPKKTRIKMGLTPRTAQLKKEVGTAGRKAKRVRVDIGSLQNVDLLRARFTLHA